MTDDRFTYRLEYADVQKLKRIVQFDSVLFELTVCDHPVYLLNLWRITQTDNIIVLTYLDQSSRVITCADAVIAGGVRLFIQRACSIYTLDKIDHLCHGANRYHVDHLNGHTQGLYLIRTVCSGSNDAEPKWLWTIICQQQNGDRPIYNVSCESDMKRFTISHIKCDDI